MNQSDYHLYNIGAEWAVESEHGLSVYPNLEVAFDAIRREEQEVQEQDDRT